MRQATHPPLLLSTAELQQVPSVGAGLPCLGWLPLGLQKHVKIVHHFLRAPLRTALLVQSCTVGPACTEPQQRVLAQHAVIVTPAGICTQPAFVVCCTKKVVLQSCTQVFATKLYRRKALHSFV